MLSGGTGDDTLIGGAGDDIIWGGELDATSGAGDGYDIVRYSDEATPVAVRFDGNGTAPGLVVASAAAGTDTLHFIDEIVLTTGNDSFRFTGTIPTGYHLRIDANGGQTEDIVDLIGAVGANMTATVTVGGVNLTSPGAAGGLIELVGFHTTILGSDTVRTTFVGAGTGAVFRAGAAGGDFTLLAGDQAYGREGAVDIFRVTTTAPAGLTEEERLDYLNNNRVLISGIGAEDSIFVNGVRFDGNNARSIQDSVRFAHYNPDEPRLLFRVTGDSSYGIVSGSPTWIAGGELYPGEHGDLDYASGSIFRSVGYSRAVAPGWGVMTFNASMLTERYLAYSEDFPYAAPQLRLDEKLTIVTQGFENGEAGVGFTTDEVLTGKYDYSHNYLPGYVDTNYWRVRDQSSTYDQAFTNFVIPASDPRYNNGNLVLYASEARMLAYVAGADDLSAPYGGELRGGRGDDRLMGQSGDERLFGGDGRDELDGREGADILYGDAGDDTLIGGDGDDRLVGGTGDDRIDGGAGYDTASYEDASVGVSVDLLIASRQNTGWGNDLIVGVEALTGSAFADLLIGNDGANILNGRAGDDVMLGRSGDDKLYGGAGADRLDGDAGADELTGGAGDDVMNGGDGIDAVRYSDATNAVRVDLVIVERQDTGWGWDQIVQVENLYGSRFDDLLVGSEDANALFGGEGDDLMGGRSGDDQISGEQGNDTIYGDAGNDLILGGSGGDSMYGGTGDDVIGGESGNDRLEGQDGADSLYGDAGADFIIGGAGNDYLHSGDGDDVMGGEDGDDVLDGAAGDDQLYGDAGNDLLLGGADDDLLHGGIGDDILGGEDGDDRLEGAAGNDQLYGDAGNDFLLGGAGADIVHGGFGDDVAGGEDGDDTMNGADGNDRFYGDAGNDFMLGGAGADLLHGGEGNDVLSGDAGDDLLIGAAGADVFVFTGVGETDTVLDFASGVDRIDLSAIDADSRTTANDAFRFIGTGAFTGAAGELRGEAFDGGTRLFGDVDGDGVADFTIVLNAAPVPVAADFVL